MDRYWFDLALILVLLLLNGLFAGSEIALISLREGQLRALERRPGRREKALLRLSRDPNRFLGTIQLGITLAGYLASATAAITLAEPLVPSLGFLGGAAEAVAITSVTIVLAVVNIVVGELAPKRLAMQYAQRWALMVAIPLDRLATITKPMVWMMGKATDVVVRIFGGNPKAAAEQLSAEELRELVSAHRGLSAEQRDMISGALEIQDRVLREILIPRRKVVMLASDLPIASAQHQLASSGHSRAPVVRSGDLDEVLGVVHLRDLLNDGSSVSDVARPALQLPDSLPVSEALQRFRSEREQFAVVIDERGGVAGIATLEDVLEEIVGEIYDETDRDVLGAKLMPDGSLILPGSFPIHDLPDLGVEIDSLPRGDYTTVAGLVLVALGRIPNGPGDRIELADLTIDVCGVDQNTITELRLTRQPADEDTTPQSGD